MRPTIVESRLGSTELTPEGGGNTYAIAARRDQSLAEGECAKRRLAEVEARTWVWKLLGHNGGTSNLCSARRALTLRVTALGPAVPPRGG